MDYDLPITIGYQALEPAIDNGHKTVVKALVEGGIDISAAPLEDAGYGNELPPLVTAMMWS